MNKKKLSGVVFYKLLAKRDQLKGRCDIRTRRLLMLTIFYKYQIKRPKTLQNC